MCVKSADSPLEGLLRLQVKGGGTEAGRLSSCCGAPPCGQQPNGAPAEAAKRSVVGQLLRHERADLRTEGAELFRRFADIQVLEPFRHSADIQVLDCAAIPRLEGGCSWLCEVRLLSGRAP